MSTNTPLTLAIFQTFTAAGTSYGAWRHPQNTSVNYLNLKHWTELAKKLDDAGFDFLFFADAHGSRDASDRYFDVRVHDAGVGAADPIVLLSALAAATERLGFVVTVSTTVDPPAALTRRFATLGHLTGGRIGRRNCTRSSTTVPTSRHAVSSRLRPHRSALHCSCKPAPQVRVEISRLPTPKRCSSREVTPCMSQRTSPTSGAGPWRRDAPPMRSSSSWGRAS
jgi:hypothetical protein